MPFDIETEFFLGGSRINMKARQGGTVRVEYTMYWDTDIDGKPLFDGPADLIGKGQVNIDGLIALLNNAADHILPRRAEELGQPVIHGVNDLYIRARDQEEEWGRSELRERLDEFCSQRGYEEKRRTYSPNEYTGSGEEARPETDEVK